MLIFSALMFLAIIFLLRLAAFVLLIPIVTAAAVIITVNAIGINCGMRHAPVFWDIATAAAALKAVSLLSSNIFLGQAVACDFYKLAICYLLCSVALVIWWMIRECRVVTIN